MSIELRPEIVDTHGFRRRGWLFTYNNHKYYIQETAGPYHVAQQIANNSWQAMNLAEAKEILFAFEQEKTENQ